MTDLVLNVLAVEATDVPKMDVGFRNTCDPYLQFKMSSSKETYKTNYIRRTLEPKWNETFRIPVKSLDHSSTLHVELIDWDKITAHDLISTHDFQIITFPFGKVVDMWYTFFAAHNVAKPGRVHLIFQLTNMDDTPFEDKLVMDERSSRMDIYVPKLSDEEILDAKKQFNEIDRDNNGYLDENELDEYFRDKKKELRCFPKLVVEIFGKNGHVTFEQYMNFYKSLAADKFDDDFIGKHIFVYIDKDKSGVIDSSEFEKVYALLKLPPGFEKHPLNQGNMNYAQFSKEFYITLRMAWYGILKDANTGK